MRRSSAIPPLPALNSLFLCVFLLMAFSLKSQRLIAFDVFQVQNSNSVNLRFTIAAGPTCNGYRIWHCIDSVNYVPIEDFNGVCGQMSTNEDRSYTHAGPTVNMTNFYRVELIPYEMSPVKRIFVTELGRTAMRTYPNPVYEGISELGLKIFNVTDGRLLGFLYNQAGRPVRELEINTVGDLATLPIGDLENGVYLIWLTDGLNPYTAKVIVHR